MIFLVFLVPVLFRFQILGKLEVNFIELLWALLSRNGLWKLILLEIRRERQVVVFVFHFELLLYQLWVHLLIPILPGSIVLICLTGSVYEWRLP